MFHTMHFKDMTLFLIKKPKIFIEDHLLNGINLKLPPGAGAKVACSLTLTKKKEWLELYQGLFRPSKVVFLLCLKLEKIRCTIRLNLIEVESKMRYSTLEKITTFLLNIS